MTANVLSQETLDALLDPEAAADDLAKAEKQQAELDLRDKVAIAVIGAIVKEPDENQQLTPNQIASFAYKVAEEALIVRRTIQFEG